MMLIRTTWLLDDSPRLSMQTMTGIIKGRMRL